MSYSELSTSIIVTFGEKVKEILRQIHRFRMTIILHYPKGGLSMQIKDFIISGGIFVEKKEKFKKIT